MIGELISALPLVAVTIHPEIKVNSLQDFSQYHIGSYEKYSTTHTYAINALSECQITPIFHQDVLKALVNRDVDIAIVLREQANEICQL
ncbi:MAG: hypothetical protein Q8O99_05550 [bacterium]|nr:hypothetical protein [bacterium]